MTYTSAHIKKFINSLEKGKIFSTRDVLIHGSRTAVDQCLCRLVKQEIIIRLARGLFMRHDFDVSLPSTHVLALAKAKAFGKQIVSHNKELGGEFSYLIGGRSSSFRTRDNQVIHFKATSPRKMYLGDSPVGLAIRNLWHQGKYLCDQYALEAVTLRFNRLERQKLRQSAHIMPAWLNHLINHY